MNKYLNAYVLSDNPIYPWSPSESPPDDFSYVYCRQYEDDSPIFACLYINSSYLALGGEEEPDVSEQVELWMHIPPVEVEDE